MQTVIEIVGVHTEKYNYIKSKLEIFISSNNINAKLEEENKISTFLNSDIYSIPLVRFSNSIMTFDSEDLDAELNFLFDQLKSKIGKSVATHDECKKCGKCICYDK